MTAHDAPTLGFRMIYSDAFSRFIRHLTDTFGFGTITGSHGVRWTDFEYVGTGIQHVNPPPTLTFYAKTPAGELWLAMNPPDGVEVHMGCWV